MGLRNNSLWNKQYLIPCLIILGNACQVAGSEIRADVGTDVLLPATVTLEVLKPRRFTGRTAPWWPGTRTGSRRFPATRARTTEAHRHLPRGIQPWEPLTEHQEGAGERHWGISVYSHQESQTADIVDITLTVTEPEVVTETSNVTRPIKIIREPEFVTETSNVTSPNKPEPDPRPFSRTRHGVIAFAALVVIILIVMFISNYCPVPDVRVENAP
ncbi:uncharacterized protein [Heptranchias perlo]|uniref:uncharacterized protein n=1 Tax=Heptranchias perlo TaxID=212740 RepID=UPI0035599D9C